MSEPRRRTRRPAQTSEGRENELISLAEDQAERQMRDGTAPAQVVVHYLKLGSTTTKLEQERLKQDNLLTAAKIEQMAQGGRIETLMEQALDAFRSYSGQEVEFYDDQNSY